MKWEIWISENGKENRVVLSDSIFRKGELYGFKFFKRFQSESEVDAFRMRDEYLGLNSCSIASSAANIEGVGNIPSYQEFIKSTEQVRMQQDITDAACDELGREHQKLVDAQTRIKELTGTHPTVHKASLFQRKTFRMHSGDMTNFKIECDALTDEDIETFALIISERFKFNQVIGVPTGGTRIADALQKYRVDDNTLPILLVDDVLTTGTSMEEMLTTLPYKTSQVIGVVLFARGKSPRWIKPVLQMW
jgi:hypothetical protein